MQTGKKLNDNKVDREYVNGQSFLYLGRNYRLTITNDPTDGLEFKRGSFVLNKKLADNGKEYFVEFYKRKLNSKINTIVSVNQKKLGSKSIFS